MIFAAVWRQFLRLISLAASPVEMRKPSSPIDAEMGHRYPLRILVAEDNLVNQKIMLRMLNRLGYSADVVRNGVEVVEAVRQTVYDVILMDPQMPEMDGLEATRQIRSDATLPSQPYIILGPSGMVYREIYLKAGVDDFLIFPPRDEDLAKLLMQSTSL